MVKRKKTQTRKKKEEDTMYVRVNNALTLRKEILQTAIEITTLLRRLESYKVLREMKMREIKDLNSLMAKLQKEFSSFKRGLPKTKVELKSEEGDHEEKEMKVSSDKDRGLSEIDRELEAIKEKLSNLQV